MKTITKSICTAFAALALGCFAVLSTAQAVVPAPDGGYPGGNTAEGQAALLSLTTGGFNTAVGWLALRSNTTGSFNTAVGAGALVLADTTDENNAFGAGALLSNSAGNFNDAVGALALFSNVDGFYNNALGDSALFNNIHGASNTAIGDLALHNNDVTGNGLGNLNTAVGASALLANTDGDSNNAVGAQALAANTVGLFNEAVGVLALGSNLDGASNVAVGDSALIANVHGSFNTVVGDSAGATVEGDNNIYIGATVADGITNESDAIRIGDPHIMSACYIGGVFGSTAGGGVGVFVDADGKLGTVTSSVRFKDDIKPMDKASESILALKPVIFRYKKDIDVNKIPQFGLVAEDVAKVNPDLVIRDRDGKPYSVRYEAVNAMLLNEFLKEHRKVQEQEATITRLQTGMKTVIARLEEQERELRKVSAQLEVSKPAPQTVLNKSVK